MNKYQIESSEGIIMGVYRGETEEDAIRAMNKDAGEEDLDRNDGLIVKEWEEKPIVSAQVKENNGGGLSIECYDEENEIVAVVAGMEMAGQATGYDDLKGIVDGDWKYTDATQWYNEDGNSMGDKGESGEELTAIDAKDDHWETKTIAEYDGNKIIINVDAMGRAGKKYFGIEI